VAIRLAASVYTIYKCLAELSVTELVLLSAASVWAKPLRIERAAGHRQRGGPGEALVVEQPQRAAGGPSHPVAITTSRSASLFTPGVSRMPVTVLSRVYIDIPVKVALVVLDPARKRSPRPYRQPGR